MDGPAGTKRRDRHLVSAVAVLALAAIALEISLWLPWHQSPLNFAHAQVFGDINPHNPLYLSLSGWSVLPLPSLLLAALGVAALALATTAARTRRHTPSLAWTVAVSAGAAGIYCVFLLITSVIPGTDIALGMHGTSANGEFGRKLEHGPGVAIALGASVILALTSTSLALAATSDHAQNSVRSTRRWLRTKAVLLALHVLASVAAIVALFVPWFGGFIYLSRPIGATSFTGFFLLPHEDAWNASPAISAAILSTCVLSITGAVLCARSHWRSGSGVMTLGSVLATFATVLRVLDPDVRQHLHGGEAAPLIAAIVALLSALFVVSLAVSDRTHATQSPAVGGGRHADGS